MTEETENAIKREIGYVEDDRPCCERCAHSTAPIQIGHAVRHCTLVEDALSAFVVHDHAVCNRFEREG